MGTLLLKVLVGALAGLACWAIFEPMAPNPLSIEAWGNWERMFTLGLGALIGLAIGGLNGLLQGGKIHTLRGAGLGLLFGAIGAPLGYGIGGGLASASPFPAETIPWRVLALTPVGTFLGLGIGASTLNGKRALQGLIGGTIGAAIGAGLFDPIGAAVKPFVLAVRGQAAGETGTISRAVIALSMGAFIALFIGIVERVARSAWVRLRLGRNEGKEWVLDAGQNFIGRSERAHIPLFGDPNIAPMHACIVRQGPNQYLLADGGTPGGTLLNGQPVSQAPLFHGAVITVGGYHLEFLLKNQPAPVRGPEAYPGQAYPLGGGGVAVPQHPQAPVPQPTPMPTQAYPQSPVAPAAAAMSFAVVAIDGPLTGQRFPIVVPTEVGREAAGIGVSFDSMASRRHAAFVPSPGGLMVTDLGSTNGTFVNGQRIQSQTLRAGDLVKIGATTFRIEG